VRPNDRSRSPSKLDATPNQPCIEAGITDAPLDVVRALVADDDLQVLEIVCRAVEIFGADVARVTSGGELLEQIANGEPFDVIVTDISMPWMTGLQVMHSARTAGLPVPVVVMTALRDADLPQRVAALGARAVLLHKPFSIQALYAALRTCLNPIAGSPPPPIGRDSES
jgi:CheY-like chemotaxis protein